MIKIKRNHMENICLKPILVLGALAGITATNLLAEDISIQRFRHYSAKYPTPVAIGDTSCLKAKALECQFPPLTSSTPVTEIDVVAPGSDQEVEIHALGFEFENRDFCKAQISIEGLSEYEATVDGKPISSGSQSFTPATHRGLIKYVSRPGRTDSLKVTIKAEGDGRIREVTDGTRMFTLSDVLYGTRINGAQISPDGAYVMASYSDTDDEGTTRHWQRIYDANTGALVKTLYEYAAWMPTGHQYYSIRKNYEHKRHIVTSDPVTGTEKIFAHHIPDGNFAISPKQDYLLYLLTREGDKEDSQVYQVLEPDDRQPGWRDRSYPALYRLDQPSALLPLTTGSEQCNISDISADGSQILLLTQRNRMGQRPTLVYSLLLLDINTMRADTLVRDDGFISLAKFSPDGKQAVVMGTPEAFGRTGCSLPQETTPSMIQTELYLLDLTTHNVKWITQEMDQNPDQVAWSQADGKIYAMAEKRDMYALYQIDPKSGKITEISTPENLVKGFDLAKTQPTMAWWGQSDSNPDRLYVTDRKGKHIVLDEPSATRLADARLGMMQDWNFVNAKGDTIYGRYYVPDDFDPSKKYPVIVDYYGGCSPSSRNFESRYPCHVYAQQGYVMYVVQPSGATGFGQEFSSRHVNTAGQGPAEDIIEGTKRFCREHEFADSTRIGCIGASYGGFMTQYLQTVTDIFAAAISHAGISDHTSYWGEGYWGYSYSEVSMANSYPWTRKDLFVEQSPLFRADKINTPILFLHGDADHNVPVGESIQMFTALKLLGVPTALVLVKDQDHHILDIEKRKKWQDTIFAWFAKYLKDEPEWWNEMYPDKGL